MFSSSFAMFHLAFKLVWLCIMCASRRQFLCCDLIAADLAPSPKEKKRKKMSSTEAFIYLFILNSDTQRACPRPHTSNKAVAADVFALRLVFRAVPVSQSRTISIKNPPRKKRAFQPGSRIKLTPGASSAKNLVGLLPGPSGSQAQSILICSISDLA